MVGAGPIEPPEPWNATVPLRAPAQAGEVARGGALVLAGITISQVMMLCSSLYLARRLGADGYGLYSLGITTLLIVVPVGTMGLPFALVRFVSVAVSRGDRRAVSGALVSAGVVALVSTGISVGVLLATAHWISNAVLDDGRMTAVLRWLAVAVPTVVLMDICASSARALGLMRQNALAVVTRAAAFLLLVLGSGSVAGGLSVRSAILSFSMAALFTSAVLVVLIVRNSRELLGRPPVWQVRPMARYAAPLVAGAALAGISQASDKYVAGVLFDSATTGRYILASTGAVYLVLVHSSLVTTVLPALADHYHQGDHAGATRLFQDIARLSLASTFPILLSAILLWRDVLQLIGGGYEQATASAVIVTFAVHVAALTGPTEGFLMATGRQRAEVQNLGVSLVLGTVAEVLLGLRYGLSGVAAGVVVFAASLQGLNVRQIQRSYGITLFARQHVILATVTSLALIVAGIIAVHASALWRWSVLVLGLAAYSLTVGRVYFPRAMRLFWRSRIVEVPD